MIRPTMVSSLRGAGADGSALPHATPGQHVEAERARTSSMIIGDGIQTYEKAILFACLDSRRSGPARKSSAFGSTRARVKFRSGRGVIAGEPQ
jgi:hypothetical protein